METLREGNSRQSRELLSGQVSVCDYVYETSLPKPVCCSRPSNLAHSQCEHLPMSQKRLQGAAADFLQHITS